MQPFADVLQEGATVVLDACETSGFTSLYQGDLASKVSMQFPRHEVTANTERLLENNDMLVLL